MADRENAHALPSMTNEARAAFARLTHGTAHEAMTLRAVNARIVRDGLTSVEQVHALIAEMLADRVQRLGGEPDLVSDAYEAASATQKADFALVCGVTGRA